MLVSVNGEDLFVEKFSIEETEEPVSVYNFQVEDFHTYFVGENGVLVHNANYPSNRQKYMGNTPSKKSNVGKIVIERMREDGKVRTGLNGDEFLSSDGNWYPIAKGHMSHIKAAVSWWNEEGRNYGAKSTEVRNFMKDPSNYEIEYGPINQSQGPHNETYLPPKGD